jgi:dipeptidyl aminopeptidase/acylaminoacyl peptidase
MKKTKSILIVLLWVFLLIPGFAAQGEKAAPQKLKTIEIEDILAWKSIRSAVLSNDGKWFTYRLSPGKGESEVITREIKGKKEFKFPGGQAPRPQRRPPGAAPRAGDISFSEDSRWVAFTIYPAEKEAETARRQKKRTYNKVGLVNLSSGKKIEFEKVRKYVFSGEASSWIALQKYPPEVQAGEQRRTAPPAGPTGAGPRQEKPSGTDLILHELISSNKLSLGNVSEFSFDKKGRLMAWIVDAQDKSGNGVQLRNMRTGTVVPLESDKAVYRRLNWTERGDALAVLKGKEDKNFEDKLYSVIGFTDFSSKSQKKIVYDPREDKDFPEGMTISPNRSPEWTEDLGGILFGIHEVNKKEETSPMERRREAEQEMADLDIWHWMDKRPHPMQQVQEARDKNFSYLSIYRVKETRFIRLADEGLKQVEPAAKHRWAIGRDNSEYELMGNLDGRFYQDIYVVDLITGANSLALRKSRWYNGISPDGSHFLYYDDGHYYTYEMATGKKYNISKDVPTSFLSEERKEIMREKSPIRPIGWVKDGVSVLLSDNWDVWNVPVHGGTGVNLTVNGKKEQIRYQNRIRLDAEENGIDLSGSVYFTAYGEWTKKAGIARVDRGKPGAKMLLWDDASFSSVSKAKAADVFLYTKQTYKDYPDYYVTDNSFQKARRITEINPQQKEYLWSSGSMLIDYENVSGEKLQGALFLPANYEKGKSYPTVVLIYRKFSQRLNNYFAPSANGFNKSVYTSAGYAVLMPDSVYRLGEPGMSALECVVPAVKAAIATGVVDKDNVAIHGGSFGGYESCFLITQTDIFKCAMVRAPFTNMVSMYSEIYWRTGNVNSAIFESRSGLAKGGYWDHLDDFIRNSPVYHAKNVKTPLLMMMNDKDGAVEWNQGIEYFNTLKRLRKPVVMLNYKGEGHGLQEPPNQIDYTLRMREFFDHHLKGKPSPKWLQKGIPHLKTKEHIKEQSKKAKKQKSPGEKVNRKDN